MSQLSILAVKLAKKGLSLIGRGGSMPGSIGLKIDPKSLNKLKFNGPVILVTGTNGKTSTSNLIASLLEEAGYKVISNRKGDNMKAGIATTLLSESSASGKIKANAVVLEVDELNVRHILPNLPVTDLVVTNFFRDQLDRAQEMEQLIESVEGAIQGYTNTLVLNGNDPNTTRLSLAAPQATPIYFGVAKNNYSLESTQEASEGKFCPVCGHRLKYDFFQYSHIGKYHCTHCSFETPELSVLIKPLDVQNQIYEINNHQLKGAYEGLYSIYNYAALHAIAKKYGIDEEKIQNVFNKAPVPFGRNESFQFKDKKLILNLIKNPTGANEVMKVIESDPEKKNIIIVLNDHEQDGTDISWIYDTNFFRITTENTHQIICCGTRKEDMALRLFYEGFNNIVLKDSTDEALDSVLSQDLPVYVITTYTALSPTRNTIVKKEDSYAA